MAMPDAIEALLQLSMVPPNRLSVSAYNVRAFNPSAAEIRASALRAFPDAEITYKVDAKRQAIVDSWPEDVDDTSARQEWDFAPAYDFDRAFHEYLIPTIRRQGAGDVP
jgi:nucleoside-diphosphate-sugar epimerase